MNTFHTTVLTPSVGMILSKLTKVNKRQLLYTPLTPSLKCNILLVTFVHLRRFTSERFVPLTPEKFICNNTYHIPSIGNLCYTAAEYF